MRAEDSSASVDLTSDLTKVDHVNDYCYACDYFGDCMFRVTMNGQLRTGTDKGNPTV